MFPTRLCSSSQLKVKRSLNHHTYRRFSVDLDIDIELSYCLLCIRVHALICFVICSPSFLNCCWTDNLMSGEGMWR